MVLITLQTLYIKILPLKQGWNEIIVIYTEGSGADGWLFSPKLSEHSDILRMNACIDYI